MKKLKLITMILIFVCGGQQVSGQQKEFKINLSGSAGDNQLQIAYMAAKLNITGHAGNEIIIKSDVEIKIPEKAKGLQPLSSNGPDNTGIGLHALYENGVAKISGVGKSENNGRITYNIMVPKSLNIKIDYKSFNAGDIYIEGLTGEVEINANSSELKLKSVSGPVILHTLNKGIEIEFAQVNQQKPSSISSINGAIEIIMSANTPANFKFNAINGEIYTDLNLKFNEEKNGLQRVGGGLRSKASNAGGGVDIDINAINGNVYLKKAG